MVSELGHTVYEVAPSVVAAIMYGTIVYLIRWFIPAVERCVWNWTMVPRLTPIHVRSESLTPSRTLVSSETSFKMDVERSETDSRPPV